MSRSPTTTENESDWLRNPHAGEMLWSEFMEPLGLSAAALATEIQASPSELQAVISGDCPVSGELDLRLSRYFRMSEGFFLRLQNSYELMQARRALNGALDRIVPRAA